MDRRDCRWRHCRHEAQGLLQVGGELHSADAVDDAVADVDERGRVLERT